MSLSSIRAFELQTSRLKIISAALQYWTHISSRTSRTLIYLQARFFPNRNTDLNFCRNPMSDISQFAEWEAQDQNLKIGECEQLLLDMEHPNRVWMGPDSSNDPMSSVGDLNSENERSSGGVKLEKLKFEAGVPILTAGVDRDVLVCLI